MAGAAILNIIGLVSGVTGLWQFAEDHIPPKAEPTGGAENPNKYITTLRVVAGLDGTNGMAYAGGNLESIQHFNLNDEQISGGSVSERIEDGVYVDFKQASSEGAQPVYTQIRASPDNVCVALMSTTWPDDSKFGWTGDVSETAKTPGLARNGTNFLLPVG